MRNGFMATLPLGHRYLDITSWNNHLPLDQDQAERDGGIELVLIILSSLVPDLHYHRQATGMYRDRS